MKKVLVLLVLLFINFVVNIGCKKESIYTNTATIIGVDARVGPCEGGTYIKIDGHPNSNDTFNGYFDIDKMPAFSIDHYPIKVKIDWNISPKCLGNYVNITRIERIL